jgi:hypothetical protein
LELETAPSQSIRSAILDFLAASSFCPHHLAYICAESDDNEQLLILAFRDNLLFGHFVHFLHDFLGSI